MPVRKAPKNDGKPAASGKRSRRSPKDARAAAPSQSSREARSNRPPVPLPDRLALARRIHSAVEKEIAAVERILTGLGAVDGVETEGTARTLASLARTLRELTQLDLPPLSPEADDDDDPVPRDIDEFRRVLARRINDFVESRTGGGLADAGEAGMD